MAKPTKEHIEKLMKNLDLTEEEALELIASDDEVDHMKTSALDNDLTDAQRKASKKARSSGKTTVGKTKIVREKKVDEDKLFLVKSFQNLLENLDNTENVNVENDQKIITFIYNGRKFKIDLSAPRK